MTSLAKIVEEALLLSQKERADIAARLLESLEDTPGSERSEEEWELEIERRAQQVEAGSKGTPWAEVRARIEQNISR